MPRKTPGARPGGPGRGPTSMRPRPDAAENPWSGMRNGATTADFNEAAARCRGKPTFAGFVTGRRPSDFNEAAARCRGKPRPPGRGVRIPAATSMRPRPDAAENRPPRAAGREQTVATSMRPRPDAAENRDRLGLAGVAEMTLQ